MDATTNLRAVKPIFYYVLVSKSEIGGSNATVHKVGAKRLNSGIFVRHSGATTRRLGNEEKTKHRRPLFNARYAVYASAGVATRNFGASTADNPMTRHPH